MEEKQVNRLDRIDRYEGVSESYKSFTVAIKISTDENRYQVQAMAITTLALLCRWCAAIAVDFDDTDCVIERYRGLQLSEVFGQVIQGQPDCKVEFQNRDLKAHALLQIGGGGREEAFWIDSNNWLAGYGYGPVNYLNGSTDHNPLGAVFAACLGVAELFRVANGQAIEGFSKWYSLVDFKSDVTPDFLRNDIPFPTEFELGNIMQVGCGAVGSNFLFFLGLTDWKVKMEMVDYDPVAEENCPNSLVFNSENVGHPKVDVCKQAFDSKRMNIEAFVDDYKAYNRNERRIVSPDILLCFANERNIWEDIQYNLPPLCFHATTTKNWGVNFGRHIPVKEWCLVCRFEDNLREKKNEVVFGCSEGLIKNENTGEETIGMLPFLSAASALLVLVDLAKVSLAEYPLNHNFLQFSFASREGVFWNLPNQRKPCYVCEMQALSLYEVFRRDSKYWYLSV